MGDSVPQGPLAYGIEVCEPTARPPIYRKSRNE